MKPTAFEYRRVETIDEAIELLAEHAEESSLLAGGQSLVPTMNFRLAQPSVIIDLNPVRDLAYIRESESGGLRIGAMTRQRAVERSPLVRDRAPLLYEAMPTIAHPQIRNRGTIGGSVAHADPSAELPAVLLALEARFLLRSQEGERWVDAADFFVGMFSTDRRPEELLAEIEIPAKPAGSGWSFREIARRHGDYALIGVAAGVTLDAVGRCSKARLTFLSAGDGVVEARQAQEILTGEALSDERIEAAAETASRDDIEPLPDMHATEEYRRHLARVLSRQALSQARDRAMG